MRLFLLPFLLFLALPLGTTRLETVTEKVVAAPAEDPDLCPAGALCGRLRVPIG